MAVNYTQADPNTLFGVFSNRFGGDMKNLGWSGGTSVLNPNYGNPELGTTSGEATMANPKFLDFLKSNNLSLQTGQSGNDVYGRLYQGDNLLSERKWQDLNSMEQFAEKAIPAVIAAGTGGILGQALGFIPGGMNPLQPSTWGGAASSGTGVPFELGNMGMGSGATTGVPFELGNMGTGVGAAAGSAGGVGTTAGGSLGSVLKGLVGAGGAGGGNIGNVLSGLASLYANNRAQEGNKQLYENLLGDFGQDSSYAKALRQELERRDSASGRRSQYGPREVELQAKLAEQRGRNATTLAALMNNQNTALQNMVRGGITLGKDLGLDGIIGDVGKGIWEGIEDSDFWQGLFGD